MADLVTQTWLEDPKSVRVILVQVDLAAPKYLSIAGLTVSGQYYEPALSRDFSITSSVTIDYDSSISYDDIEVINNGGVRDSWLTELWVNKPIRVYFGDASWTTLTNFKLVFAGIVGNLDSKNRDSLNIIVRDSLQKLNYPIGETKLGNYNPTNISPYTNPNSEQIRPLTFGEVFNITPLLTSSILYEYMCNNGEVAQILEVRDNGVPIEFATSDPRVLATSSSSHSITLGSKTFASADTSLLHIGMFITIYYTTDTTKSLRGNITTLVANTSFTVNVLEIAGTGGPFTAWAARTLLDTNVFAVSTSSHSITIGSKVFTCANTTFINVGMVVNIYYDTDISKYLIGTITAITPGVSATVNITSVVGSGGPFTSWSFRLPIPPGSFRLPNRPIGTVTSSLQGTTNSTVLATNAASTVYTNNAINILATIIRLYAKNSPNINTASFVAAAALSPGTAALGIYAIDRFNVFSLANEIASSIGMCLYINSDGEICLTEVEVPIGASISISNTDILLNTLSISNRSEVLAGHRFGYAKNWTVQEGMVVDIPEEHKLEFSKEWKELSVLDGTVQSNYGLSSEIPLLDTYLVDYTQLNSIANTKLLFRKVPHNSFTMTLTSKHLLLQVGTAVTLTSDRFGLNGGVYGMIISTTPNFITGTIDIEVLT